MAQFKVKVDCCYKSHQVWVKLAKQLSIRGGTDKKILIIPIPVSFEDNNNIFGMTGM